MSTYEPQDKLQEVRSKVASTPTAIWAIPGAIGAVLLLKRLLGSVNSDDHYRVERHHHEALQHDHEHVHVTHERTDDSEAVGGWAHLTASHKHDHNHPAVAHEHRPHRSFEAEHRREAHVHDHGHPTTS